MAHARLFPRYVHSRLIEALAVADGTLGEAAFADWIRRNTSKR